MPPAFFWSFGSKSMLLAPRRATPTGNSKTLKGCASALQEGTRSTVTCRRRSGSCRSDEGLATSLAQNSRWLRLPKRVKKICTCKPPDLESKSKYAAQKRRCRTLLQVLQPAERLLDRKFYRVFMGSGLVNKKYQKIAPPPGVGRLFPGRNWAIMLTLLRTCLVPKVSNVNG